MKVTRLEFRRDPKQPKDVNVLRNLVAEHITGKGGKIASSWSMQQCGSTIWYDCHGYIGEDQCVTIRYNWL